ncbi:MAG: hypothetical protein NZ480_05825 [Bdellovibrionaceae bacterium]|nr:hypothetical protein [Pseudobdellovibrionaceae bacterium]MDW8190794.1 hypothetical protein [Pseudobdellovibrionaceae bacterium]
MSTETEIERLITIPDEMRDAHWEHAFLSQLCFAQVRVMQPDPIVGPDSWPYLHVRLDSKGQEPMSNILLWLSTRGIGLVVDHQENQTYPDYVMPWGTVWWMVKNKTIPTFAATKPLHENINVAWKHVAWWGAPSEDFLPAHVRKILREFFLQQNVLSPKYLLISFDQKVFNLAFSLESLGKPPIEEHQNLLEALSWFFPPHYPLMLLTEEGSPPFYPL